MHFKADRLDPSKPTDLNTRAERVEDTVGIGISTVRGGDLYRTIDYAFTLIPNTEIPEACSG